MPGRPGIASAQLSPEERRALRQRWEQAGPEERSRIREEFRRRRDLAAPEPPRREARERLQEWSPEERRALRRDRPGGAPGAPQEAEAGDRNDGQFGAGYERRRYPEAPTPEGRSRFDRGFGPARPDMPPAQRPGRGPNRPRP